MATTHHTVAALAAQLGGEVRGDPHVTVTGINAIDDATRGDVTFVSHPRYAQRWAGCAASAAVVSAKVAAAMPEADTRPVIVVADAEIASIYLLKLFAPAESVPSSGVDPLASVHATAQLGTDVRVGPYVSIGPRVQIGDRVVLHPGVRLYDDAAVGEDSVLHGNVVVRERCQIGRRVIIHANVSIGSDGFGYRPDPDGAGLLKVPHLGAVQVHDDVEIGANTCVDRAKFGFTVIGAGTKIDNLCQIAHNVRIGRCCVVAAQTGLSGSVVLGDGVQIGGRGGASDHVTIGSGARLGGNSVAFKDVPPGATWIGFPADEASATKRQWASLRRLPQLIAAWRCEGTKSPRTKPPPDPS